MCGCHHYREGGRARVSSLIQIICSLSYSKEIKITPRLNGIAYRKGSVCFLYCLNCFRGQEASPLYVPVGLFMF